MQPSPARQPHPVPSVEVERSTSIRRILGALAADPYNQILRRWNWKSAVMSALIRAIIFFSTNIVAGLHAALAAVAADMIYRLTTAGFYGTVTQALRRRNSLAWGRWLPC